MEIVIATTNEHKLQEYRELFSSTPIQLLSLHDVKFYDEIVEDGTTFIENALIKARTVAKKTNKIVLADDSGLCVEALSGAPGLFSARYLGIKTDRERRLALLKNLSGEVNRSAKFVAAIAIVVPDQKEYVYEGITEGLITNHEIGEHGFGYDPIFLLPKLNKTMAELTSSEKNTLSHRGKACQKVLIDIPNILFKNL